jgi:hypothetical protein
MSTKILNTSPLAQIVEDDNRAGAYPQILRTGDSDRLGNSQVLFDDSKINVYTRQTVLMPYNIPAKDAVSSLFMTGTLSLTKTPSPASQFLTKFENTALTPFNESSHVASFFTEAQREGTPSSVYPGFDSPITTKIAIEIDITPSADKKLFKMIASRAVDTAGTFYNQSGTGFAYFNFKTRKWEDIGLTDPVYGKDTGYDFMLRKATGDAITGKNNEYMCQFMPSPSVALSGQLAKSEKLSLIGYDKIGTPTAFFGAPNSSRYHATSSQALKLSDYIQHPFVLEKVYLDIPTSGIRVQDPGTPYPAGFFRDIVNYVFFMYKQNRVGSQVKDSVQDVSSSIRSIVTNGSFCYYNSASISAGVGPQHEFGQAFDHMMNSSTYGKSDLSGRVSMFMTPKIYNEQLTGLSPIPITSQAPPVSSGESVRVQHFWTGGTKGYTTSGSLSIVGTVSNRTIASYTGVNSKNRPQISLSDQKLVIDPRPLKSSVWESSTAVRINDYYTASGGPPIQFFQTTSEIENYRETPYILFPNDEIVFGIDAGQTSLSSYTTVLPISSQDQSALGITGSYLQIPAQPAKVILYGSLILNNQELLSSLNQNLTSNAIHEDLHEVIVDQFETAERILYSGSYLDSYYTGSIGVGAGRVYVGRASTPTTYPKYAFNRFTTLSSISEKFVKAGQTTPIVNFRASHFGHYRDMLEQTKDSEKTYVSYVQKTSNLLDFSRPSKTKKIDSII